MLRLVGIGFRVKGLRDLRDAFGVCLSMMYMWRKCA